MITDSMVFFKAFSKLYAGPDHEPLLAYFRKVDPKPLDHIVNKRLQKYVSEIRELRFSIFHIPGADNFLSDRALGFLQESLVMTGEIK